MCWFRLHDRETALVCCLAVPENGETGSTDEVDEMVEDVDSPLHPPGDLFENSISRHLLCLESQTEETVRALLLDS